jgi:hypothetical protein
MDINTAIERIKEAFSEEYEEIEIFAMLQEIPEALWKDEVASHKIVQALVDYKIWEWDIPITDFIPSFFWNNKVNAEAAMKIILSSNRSDIYGIFPSHLRTDRDSVMAAVSSDWRELDGLSETFTSDADVVYAAFENMIQEIESTRENYPRAMIEPRSFLESLLGYVSKSLKSNKAFVLAILKDNLAYSNEFCDECDLLYDWINPQLWSDKEFVMQVLEIDCTALEWVSEDLKASEEFNEFLEENYG